MRVRENEMTKAGYSLLPLLLYLGAAFAEQPDEGKVLLDRFLSDVTTMSARFEQSLVDADDIVVEE